MSEVAGDLASWEALAGGATPGTAPLGALCSAAADAPRYLVAVARPVAGGGDADEAEVVYLPEPAISSGQVVVPGSFNPMHEGHEELAARAAEVVGRNSVLFELCVSNADKGAQPLAELERRAALVVRRGHRLLITRAALYKEKAALCHGCDFVVGYDTYRRIVNPKYYLPEGKALDGSTEDEQRAWVLSALHELQEQGIRLLVAGRVEDDGTYSDLEQAPLFKLPDDMADLILSIPGFRMDISSTALRKQMAEKQV